MKVFPSISAWIQASKLYLVASTGVLLPAAMFWILLLTALVMLATEAPELAPLVLLLAIASLLAGLAYYQVVKLLYWSALKLLWAKPPAAINVKGFRASLHSYAVLIVASLPLTVATILIGLITLPAAQDARYGGFQYHEPATGFIVLISWLWLIIAAYLYQWFPCRRRQPQALGE